MVVPLGEPFTLQSSVSLTLRRSRGSNVVLIGDLDEDDTTDLSVRGAAHSCIAAACRLGARVRVVDFIGDEVVDAYASIDEVARASGADYYRGRNLAAVVAEVATTVGKRLADGDYSAPTEMVVLFGLQRALSVKPPDPYGDDPEARTASQLADVLRDGPEVGVHVVTVIDSVMSLERRLGHDALAELALRVGGSLASPADLQFVTGTYSSPADVRRNQLVLGDQQRGSVVRMRAYPPLSHVDLESRP